MVRARQHATVATHPAENMPSAQSRPAAEPSTSATSLGLQAALPTASVAIGQQGPPTDKREVFRIPSPCGEQGTPRLSPQGNQRLTQSDTHNGAQHPAPTDGTLDIKAGKDITKGKTDGSRSGSEKHRGSWSGTRAAQLCQNGDGGSMGGMGTGMMEGFGVGSSALESAQPEEFGGLQIEWAAERSRWALRSQSAPSLVASSAPNSRKVRVFPNKVSQETCISIIRQVCYDSVLIYGCCDMSEVHKVCLGRARITGKTPTNELQLIKWLWVLCRGRCWWEWGCGRGRCGALRR